MMKRMIARLARLGGLAALVLISHWAWAAMPEVFYVHNDQLGTPRAVVDGNNVEVWRWEGDAYGEQPPEQDPSGTGQAFVFNLRYPGQYYDVETGRMYNGWRDYDPSTGRYVQSDPLGLEGGQWSTYAYVGGNPVNKIDPTGEFSPALPVLCFTTGACESIMSAVAGLGIGAAAYTVVDKIKKSCQSDQKDPCEEIRRKIRDIEGKLASKERMLAKDPYKLKDLAYSINPGGNIEGKGTYLGHVAQIDGLKKGLARAIAEAKAMGCL